MTEPVMLLSHPKWSVQQMTIEEIPLIISWIAELDPSIKMDQAAIAKRMKKELTSAKELKFPEHYIGYFEQMPAFYFAGFLIPLDVNLAPKKITRQQDYEVTILLINALFTRELYLPLFHQSLKFLFERPVIGRVIFQLDKNNHYEQDIILRLGFKALTNKDKDSTLHQWYACKRSDFISL